MNTVKGIEKKINSELGTKIKSSSIKHNQIYVSINVNELVEVMMFLKTHQKLKFKQLIDITAVDYPSNEKRFKIVYFLLSHEFNQRIIIQSLINENEKIDSISNVFPSANWMEREVFDMYGITFKNHPDLRRILTDYNFEGHPLIKTDKPTSQ